MSILTQAADTATANNYVHSGWAAPGDLLLNRRNGKVVRVTEVRRLKYLYLDEDGREWLNHFRAFDAAPVGAVFNGPEKPPSAIRAERRAAEAMAFKVGDTVEFFKPKDVRDAPGKFLITKKTSATRFKLVGIGSGLEFTAPAALIRKAE